jgi:hypothetical protein
MRIDLSQTAQRADSIFKNANSDLPFLLRDEESPADVSTDSESQIGRDPSQVVSSSKHARTWSEAVYYPALVGSGVPSKNR